MPESLFHPDTLILIKWNFPRPPSPSSASEEEIEGEYVELTIPPLEIYFDPEESEHDHQAT